MRTIEEVKKRYLDWPEMYGPSKEEIEYYNLNENVYKEWVTEKLLTKRKALFEKIDSFYEFFKSIESVDSKINELADIYWHFDECMSNYTASDSYYYCLPETMKKMFDNDMFDYISYVNENRQYSFAYKNAPLDPSVRGIPISYEYCHKYSGMLIQVYYHNPKIYEELLLYFANTIYQKYGLYLQYDMNILIQFCYEYNLPYVDLLYDAHKRAMELDYASNHEYKYQLKPRKEIKWEENVLSLRTIKEIKNDYVNNKVFSPTKHEQEYYLITEDVLKFWNKEYELTKRFLHVRDLEEIKEKYLREPYYNHPTKDEMDYYKMDFNTLDGWITEFLLQKQTLLLEEIEKLENNNDLIMDYTKIDHLLHICMEYYPATKSYYCGLPILLKRCFESDIFDIYTFHEHGIFSVARVTSMLKQNNYEFKEPWQKQRKYAGCLVFVYYNNQEAFEELLLYFANVIYQKYGLYFQSGMKTLINFCIEFNLPYVDILCEAHKKAKELDYPANHEFKYQLKVRRNVKWTDININE